MQGSRGKKNGSANSPYKDITGQRGGKKKNWKKRNFARRDLLKKTALKKKGYR